MTDLIWASDTWKNPPIMKKEEMSPDTKTPFNQNINFFVYKLMGNKQTKATTKVFLGRIKGRILKTKSRCLYLIIFDSQLEQIYKGNETKNKKERKRMEMDEEEKKG